MSSELSPNAVKVTKNICCEKGDGTVDHSAVTRCFKKFHLDCKNLNNQARSSKIGKSGESQLKSIRRVWHLTVQHSELLNFAL